MTILYDGTFAGWLTAVFDIYEYKFTDTTIRTDGQQQLFGETYRVQTDEKKSQRVWKGLQQKTSSNASKTLYRTFLSEERGVEDRLFQYVKQAFAAKQSIEHDYSNPIVLYVVSTAKKVYREKHRMEAFVRFQSTKDNIYYAVIDPDFNVLPLIQPHFERRYADQRWIIYDSRRKTGLYYDLEKVESIEISFSEGVNAGGATTVMTEEEPFYQQLWQQYFDSVNISSRRNMKLHIRHMPLRYWKYLPEQQPRT